MNNRRIGKGLRELVAHLINPLHVYCRLRDLGFNKMNARRITNLLKGGTRC
jgi:hypothetical protein